MRNADSWGMAFIVLGTAATMWMLPSPQARNPHAVAQVPATLEVPADKVDYRITVATKRIPAECKSLGADSVGDLIARCQSLTAHGTQMTMVPVDATVQVANQPD